MSSRRLAVRTLPLVALLCACPPAGEQEPDNEPTEGPDDVTTIAPGSTTGGPETGQSGDPEPGTTAHTTTLELTGQPGSSGGATTTGAETDTGETSATGESSGTTDGVEGCEPDDEPVTFDYIWIANTSQGTVSKINTATGVEEARYRTAQVAAEPSRTSVNQYGDVAVSNRYPGSVTKIAALPERCVDVDRDGVIETSTGPNDIRPWGEDECVLWNRPIPSVSYTTGPRPTAWEATKQDPESCETPTPRLWVGFGEGNGKAAFWRLRGDSGEKLDQASYVGWSGEYGPYGGAVNGEGDLFAIGIADAPIVRVDAETLAVSEIMLPTAASKYGVALDKNGNLWISGTLAGANMFHHDFGTASWTSLGSGGGNWILGVAVDQEGRVWGAGSGPCRLVEASVEDVAYTNTSIELPSCSQPWGVSVDDDGYVWVVDKANKAYKVDPDTYAVELIVTELIGP
ncbi:MAG: hypothetical protein KC468_31095, partial [Myxococcales bacterium]|nr:hypothetical protein [Myxococcales bacterium]